MEALVYWYNLTIMASTRDYQIIPRVNGGGGDNRTAFTPYGSYTHPYWLHFAFDWALMGSSGFNVAINDTRMLDSLFLGAATWDNLIILLANGSGLRFLGNFHTIGTPCAPYT